MVHIFFVPGMFGSTLEYALRNFTNKFQPVVAEILPDGSMHSFNKETHLYTIEGTKKLFNSGGLIELTTPIYPTEDYHPEEFFSIFKSYVNAEDQIIFLHAGNLADAELNILFQYHKIAHGVAGMGDGIFYGKNIEDVKKWNSSYESWGQMTPWESREWFSLYYSEYISEWIDALDIFKKIFNNFNYLTVLNSEFLQSPENTFLKIVNFLTLNVQGEYSQFFNKWTPKQQYIVDEYLLTRKIINCIINNQYLEWRPENLNVISEAIIQQNLRRVGYDIKCYGLNEFPTNTKDLKKLLTPLN